ncbi:MAG: DNA methyltransferase, partial [Candidatus Poribacteria bacterium]|nr:DNA methyltransferase [Candidatus Poribacteria bacterium]
MADRLITSEQFMASESCFFCHIDESEYEKLFLFFNSLQMDDQGSIVWDKRNPIGASNTIATQHEYTICRSKGNVKLKAQHVNGEMILKKCLALAKAYGGITTQCRNDFKTWINKRTELSGMERSYSNIDENGHVYTTVHMGAGDVRTDPKYFRPLIHPTTKKPCPVPKNGWSSTPEYLDDLLQKNEVSFGVDEKTQPRRKCYLKDNLIGELTSVISTGERGKHILDAFGLDFPYSHPVGLYEKLVWSITTDGEGIVLDFFAGSGTNAHATINLNRKDQGNRKYILIEMGHHFETVLKPRVLKAVYAEKWKNAKPVSRDSRLSQIIKYQSIESYEDALNNIQFTERENSLFEEPLLSYLLGSETRESSTFLNVTNLQNPFSYQLNIIRDMQTHTQNVDLPETFNYLLGVSVQTRRCLYDDDRRYLVYRGTVGQKTVIIIWRETEGWEQQDWERDYDFIQEHELIISADKVYVNTDSIIPESESLDPLFKRLMFSYSVA